MPLPTKFVHFSDGRFWILARQALTIPGHTPIAQYVLVPAVKISDGTIAPDYPVVPKPLLFAGQSRRDVVDYLLTHGYEAA